MSDWVLIALSVLGGIGIGGSIIVWLLKKATADAVGRKLW
jgi:hypothetical protein